MHPNVHCCTIYNSQVMEATLMPIDRLMDKEDVVHVYNGILLSHKKEWNWVICGDVDGPRDCVQSEVSQKEKNKYCILTHMWSLEKWYRWTSLQGRNRDTDVENKHMGTKGESGGGQVVVLWWIGRLRLTYIH